MASSNATSAARPKRAGEDFARAYESASKKPRFDHRNPSTLAPDAPEEDLILDADVIGKSGTQTKRNAVNIDGYESDSDNDNFDARAAEKAKAAKRAANGAQSKDEEDDDIFADLEQDVQGTADGDEDEELTRHGKKKKDVRFLDQDEIEGQVMSSKSGGHVSSELLMDHRSKAKRAEEESDSASSGSDDERDQLPEGMDEELAAEVGAGGKKKHAPRLDAFNLEEEKEEGLYDESGNYVRKAVDPDAVNDNWLEGLSKKDIKRAREAQEKRDDEQRRKAMEEDAILSSDLLSTLLQNLETGETPFEALARLNKSKSKEAKVPKWKQKRLKDKMDVDNQPTNGNGTSVDQAEAARRACVETITGAADSLYSRGQHKIYETERELLLRQYRRETGDDWQPPQSNTESGAAHEDAASVNWEYRWSDARDGGGIHGPYDAPTMKAWNEAGYFGEGVEFRRVGDDEWSRLLELEIR